MTSIPFSKPYLSGRELEYVSDAIRSRSLAGNGPYTRKCVELLGRLAGVPAMLTSSGTHALELAMLSLRLKAGDEVIIPSYTFMASATSAVQVGLTPVFVDVRPDTVNIDEALIEQAIGPRTRGIMPVHYAGVGAAMDSIMEVAERHDLVVVEDASHAVGARYRGRPLGSVGDLGVFSFHQTKNMTSGGEGGALLIRNPKYLEAAEVHHEVGTDRGRFLRGEISQYSWVDRGSNYLMSDVLAAFLAAQLEAESAIKERRRTLYFRYCEALAPLATRGILQLPMIPPECDSNFHFFHCLVDSHQRRDGLRAYLRGLGIAAAVHYTALHATTGGLRFGVSRGPMDVSTRVERCILRLPFYTDLTIEDQDRVIAAVNDYISR